MSLVKRGLELPDDDPVLVLGVGVGVGIGRVGGLSLKIGKELLDGEATENEMVKSEVLGLEAPSVHLM